MTTSRPDLASIAGSCENCGAPVERAQEPTLGFTWQHADTTAIACHWPRLSFRARRAMLGPARSRPLELLIAQLAIAPRLVTGRPRGERR
jgi:hypothetical protein